MLYAWASGMNLNETFAAAQRFPGLGMVLTARNYDAVDWLEQPAYAYVGNLSQAYAVAEHSGWAGAIVLDERNQVGPYHLEPAEYDNVYFPIRTALMAAKVPAYTMGLAPTFPTWHHGLLWRGQYDHAYHKLLPPAHGRAWNPNKVRLRDVQEVLERYPDTRWLLSPAPFRRWPESMFQPVSIAQWAAIAQRDNVDAVAFWCLRETVERDGTPQRLHGLLNADGEMTAVGRAVLRQLPKFQR